ncbi:MAG: rod shape-determining protein MreC [Oscillospiraceae bacterium]|jgi:rod shape-determining protein MreC|nr:rod shape-determining protein MreC [Oscillospiraceae bacterium]
MQQWLKGRNAKIFAGILAALLLGMLAAALSADATSPLTRAVGFVFSPLQTVSTKIAGGLRGFGGHFVSSGYYQQRIEELELELEGYRAQLVDFEIYKQQLESYKGFLEIKEKHEDFEFAPATVIGRDAADAFRSFVINRGSADGVSVNDPVIYESYLVGVVKEVGVTSSVVWSILDPRVSVSAYEIRSREDGYLANTAALSLSGLSRLSGLDRATTILPGGIVCTSGVGGIFPRDLILGTVKEVLDQKTDISSYAVIEPGVDYANLIDVFVITSFLGQGEAE